MRFLLPVAVLVFAAGAFAEEVPYRGFRADLRDADAVLRVKLGEACEGPRPAVVEHAFKGECKEGDTVSLTIDAEGWSARLSAELANPGGIRGRALPFFEQPAAPGDSQIVLLKRVEGALKAVAFCLSDPASTEPADEARARDRRTADEFVTVYVMTAGNKDNEAALLYFSLLSMQFADDSPGASELAIGVLSDDFARVRTAFPLDATLAGSIASAHKYIVGGGADRNAQAAALRPWLTRLLTETQRREAAGAYAEAYRKARREAEEAERKEREPKDPRRKPETERFEATAAKRFGLQSRLKELPKLIALALDPVNPPEDLSSDELLEKADEFSKPR